MNGWDWGNGMIIDSYIIDSYCGSFPHSLLSTSKNLMEHVLLLGKKNT